MKADIVGGICLGMNVEIAADSTSDSSRVYHARAKGFYCRFAMFSEKNLFMKESKYFPLIPGFYVATKRENGLTHSRFSFAITAVDVL